MNTEPLPSSDRPDPDRSRPNSQDSPATHPDAALTERIDPIPDAFAEAEPQKRSRVLPIALAAVGIVSAGVLGYAVVSSIIVGVASTSAAEQSTPPPPAPTSLPASPTPTPTPTPTPSPSTLPVSGDRPIAGVNECVDVVGDGGAVDLDVVRLEEGPLGLVATYHLAEMPDDGDMGVGIVAQSDDGELVYQIAAHWVDGDLEQYFVYDVSRDSTSLSLDNVQTQGKVVATLLPDDVIASLGDDWSWYAFSVAEGQDADGCPSDQLIPFVDERSNDNDNDNSNGDGNGNSGGGNSGRDRDRD